MKEKILVSSCLIGLITRYDGRLQKDNRFEELAEEYDIIPFCPEQAGGLPTPRKPCEIYKNRVLNVDGDDKTENFIRGAKEALKLCKLFNIKKAILKSKSPSCGKGKIYDGTFSGNLISGDGFTTRLLEDNGIEVTSM
ncbi:DUF523 domain-containing protein [Lagierella sp.]|uniref:DUF523 domain-containing protein n=1 Tax=Lagierella sp. TaxID=2849657 RepID=UPI002633AD68|nr:DUF523 domain-containing protein [Lagierella sp.]